MVRLRVAFEMDSRRETYLQEHLEPIEGRRTGPGHGSSETAGSQMAPPHATLHLALREVIRYVQIFANVQILKVIVIAEKGSTISTAVSAVSRNGTHNVHLGEYDWGGGCNLNYGMFF